MAFECSSIAAEYMNFVLNDSDVKKWYEAAKHEPEVIEISEVE